MSALGLSGWLLDHGTTILLVELLTGDCVAAPDDAAVLADALSGLAASVAPAPAGPVAPPIISNRTRPVDLRDSGKLLGGLR